jgi:hypothetical protein
MAQLMRTREVFSKVDRVWGLVSDLGNEGEYWSSCGDVQVLDSHDNVVEIELSFLGARNLRSRESHLLYPKKSISTRLTGGQIVGERDLVLVPLGRNSTRVDIKWRLEPRGLSSFAFGLVSREIAMRTEEALNRIEESTAVMRYQK